MSEILTNKEASIDRLSNYLINGQFENFQRGVEDLAWSEAFTILERSELTKPCNRFDQILEEYQNLLEFGKQSDIPITQNITYEAILKAKSVLDINTCPPKIKWWYILVAMGIGYGTYQVMRD